MKFLPKLLWHVRHSHMIVVSRIAHFVSKLTIFDGELLEAIAERSINEIETMRSKDIERICNAISVFNYKSNMSMQLLQKISEYLLTVDKGSNASYEIRAIDFMQRCGVCDPKLVAWALDPKTIAQAYSNGKKTNRIELIRIDMYAKINMANEYTGPKLSSVECNAIFQQKLAENTDGPVQQAQRQILDILKTYGRQYARTYILPHFETPGKLFSMKLSKSRSIKIKILYFSIRFNCCRQFRCAAGFYIETGRADESTRHCEKSTRSKSHCHCRCNNSAISARHADSHGVF